MGVFCTAYRLRFLLANYYSTCYNPYFLPVMLKSTIQHVIDDSSFHLKVEPAATALQQAKYVAEWSGKDENRLIFEAFEKRLVKELKGCCHLMLQIRMPDLLCLFDQISEVGVIPQCSLRGERQTPCLSQGFVAPTGEMAKVDTPFYDQRIPPHPARC